MNHITEEKILSITSDKLFFRRICRQFCFVIGISSKYLQNYLNWDAYKNQINNNKETIKMWFVVLLMSPVAYDIFLKFKENTMLIRTYTKNETKLPI